MKITYYMLMFFYLACLINVVTVICEKPTDEKTKKGKKSSNANKKGKKKKDVGQPQGTDQEMVQKEVQEMIADSVDMEATADDVRDILMNVFESEEMQKKKKAMQRRKILLGVLSAVLSLAVIAGGSFGGYKLYKKKKKTTPQNEYVDQPSSNPLNQPINSPLNQPGGSDQGGFNPWGEDDRLPNFEK